MGRQLDERDMSRIFPSFPDLSLPDGLSALPCAPNSGGLANGGAGDHAAATPAPPAPAAANGDDGGVRSMLTPVPSFKEAGACGGAPQALQVRALCSRLFVLLPLLLNPHSHTLCQGVGACARESGVLIELMCCTLTKHSWQSPIQLNGCLWQVLVPKSPVLLPHAGDLPACCSDYEHGHGTVVLQSACIRWRGPGFFTQQRFTSRLPVILLYRQH